ncbi:C40 family peptidase [Sanguibacter sp. HDW7]|uniref:C40 family peptidase n=1 Tax=Sanguibacter sp. HDW7 TaxID=2714931 RepID=UPI001408AB66|nr:C40 family peptidase [Sanguibacter sp. HDW7]QIK84566.1 C40 family peptidase [Sanguibacter sp. HDW7]
MTPRTTDVVHGTAPSGGPSTSTPTRSRSARRTVATLVATLGIGLVPAVGTATAHAEPAAQSASADNSTRLSVTRSATTTYEGRKGSKLSIRLRNADEPVDGRVKVYDGKKLLRTLTASDRNDDGRLNLSYRLPKSLKVGKHTITLKFLPAASTDASSAKRTTKVRVRSEGELIVRTAKRYIGTPYRYGGTTPRGFDCSGFTSYVYKKAGVAKLPRSSSAQRGSGKVVARKNARPGDLIWTRGHVAIYVGNGKQIDAPRPGKSIKVRDIWQSNPTFLRV